MTRPDYGGDISISGIKGKKCNVMTNFEGSH